MVVKITYFAFQKKNVFRKKIYGKVFATFVPQIWEYGNFLSISTFFDENNKNE